jgi:hypothetical protein
VIFVCLERNHHTTQTAKSEVTWGLMLHKVTMRDAI